jgi:hypothetical protein
MESGLFPKIGAFDPSEGIALNRWGDEAFYEK